MFMVTIISYVKYLVINITIDISTTYFKVLLGNIVSFLTVKLTLMANSTTQSAIIKHIPRIVTALSV